MILKNATIINDKFKPQKMDIQIEGERIAELGMDLHGDHEIDYTNCYIMPGFIDTHIHGAYGVRISDRDPDLTKITRFEATQGVTSIAITTGTSEFGHLLDQMRLAARSAKAEPQGTKIAGIHVEGPFICEKYKGAMTAAYIQKPSVEKFQELMDASEGLIKIITIAPETEGAESLIRYASLQGVKVSMGHTASTYEESMRAVRWGASRATHTFNAMRPYNHREPGILGAVLTSPEVDCEMICDYVHLHPATVRMIYQLKGAGHIAMVSDSGNAAGLNVEKFEVDGVMRYVKDGVVRLENGTIAGSAMTLLNGVQHLIRDGIPMGDVAKMASYNPARALGMEQKIGSIAVGKIADLAVLDSDLAVAATYVNGRKYEE